MRPLPLPSNVGVQQKMLNMATDTTQDTTLLQPGGTRTNRKGCNLISLVPVLTLVIVV